MLRSQGIPARMIVGYKGCEFNSLGRYYQVRQRHAHAWVEALLPAGQAPEWEIAGPPSGGGTWYRLEPTPIAPELAEAGATGGLAHRAVEAFDYVELLWRDYVLSLNAAKQKESLYDPVSSRALGPMPAWMDTAAMQAWQRRLAAIMGRGDSSSDERHTVAVFDWSAALAATLFLALLALSVQSAIWLWPLFRGGSRNGPRQKRAPGVGPPEFYLRLVGMLARMKLRRASGQTARELAFAAESKLAAGPAAFAAPLPEEVVAAYYRVRFGGAALDKNEQAAIEQALAKIVSAVHYAQS
jgi:hypothetical protein